MARLNCLKYWLVLIVLVPMVSYSHPHSFVTLKTSFYTEENKLTKIHFNWTLDDFTSSYLKLDYDQDPQGTFDDLMIGIYQNHFFSELWLKTSSKDKAIMLLPQSEGSDLRFDSGKAIINFWAKLQQPIELHNTQFELISYEKTFYVDLYYDGESALKIDNENCTISLNNATPDDSVSDYAQSLDQDETPIETDEFVLGKLFAQKVVVSCK